MPKTNINDILKDVEKIKLKPIDYSLSFRKKELEQLRKESEAILKRKYNSLKSLMEFEITK